MQKFITLFFAALAYCASLLSDDTALTDQAKSIPDFYHSVNVIDGEFLDSRVDLEVSGPYGLEVKRWSSSLQGLKSQAHGWVMLPLDIFANDSDKPKENVLPTHKMVFDYDKQGVFKGIQIQSPDGKKVYNSLKIVSDTPNGLEIEALSGQRVAYEFQADSDKRKLLTCVKAPGRPEVRYTYQPHAFEKRKVIAGRSEPQGRLLQIEYYSADDAKSAGEFSKGKVKALKAPSGNDASLVTIARFVYRPGETEVYDALNHKTVYKYDQNSKRLSAVESQHPDGKSGTPYRIHRFYWDNQRLVSKTVEDGQKRVYQCETFAYDKTGRITKETLWGNLTGNSPNPFSVDGNGKPTGQVESYSKTYSFANEETSLPSSVKEDNGKEVRYSFNPSTQRIESQLTLRGGQIVRREFYQYNSEGALQKTIVDDGRSPNCNDLAGVTERHIQVVTAYAPPPNVSLAQCVEEKYLNLSNGQEVLLNKKVNIYSPEGRLLSQEAYDSDGILRERTLNTYDKQGRLLSSSQLDGNVITYSYDELGNPLRRTSTKDKMDTQFVYDYSNRLIRQDELTTDGQLRGIANVYDKVGNKIASTDSCGNTTNYSYDALNRLVATTHPAVLDAHGRSVRYQVQANYDLFDRVTATVDADGLRTETQYNIRGKPIEVRYPDGTVETARYNPDGTIQKTVDRKGNTTSTVYDSLGNPVEVTVTSPAGRLFQRTRSTYSGFRLLSTEDHAGRKTVYAYDGAGRQIAVSTGFTRTEFTYDAQGEIASKKEWFGLWANDYRITATERDANNQIQRVSIKDSSGRLVKLISPGEDEGKTPPYAEAEQRVPNGRGQWVRQISVTDAQGIVSESTMDALNRIETIRKKDPYGQVISQIDYLYDSAGNTCRETHTIFSADAPNRLFSIVKTWGYDHRLLSVIEGEGSPEQKITRYSYNSHGLLTAIQKPDGKLVLQDYNDIGQLVRLYASDNSFDYRYTYDDKGCIVKADDLLNGWTTARQHDHEGRLTAETLGTGLKSAWAYDFLGRLISTQLPDNSSIHYRYNAADLIEIERRQHGNSYVHRYTHDIANGRVSEAELMGGAGRIRFSYNANGKPMGVDSPYWSQTIDADGRDKLGRLVRCAFRDPLGASHAEYQYDSLSHLTQEKAGSLQSYSYDSIDNRTSHNGRKTTLNGLNQLLTNGQSSFSYDANGNILQENRADQSVFRYTYDAFNRLTKVVVNDKEAYQYIYDPFNRRIAKIRTLKNEGTGAWEQQSMQKYLYYGDQEIGAANSNGAIEELRVLGIGIGAEIGAAVLMELHGRAFVPIHDLQGSVRCLVDINTKEAAEFYRYTAFGETSVYSNSGSPLSQSSIGNPWLYSSKRFDTETQHYFYGKRYYAPESGRWFTPDPIGFADGPNLYAFVHQNPLNANDLYGLFSFSDLWNAITDFFSMCFNKIADFFKSAWNWVKTYLSPAAIKDYFHFLAYEAIGRGYALLKGDSNFRSFRGVYGNGEINDKVRLTFINGIYTEPQHLADNVESISKSHGGINVHYVYSATRGIILDGFRALRIKLGFTSPEAHMLADTWRQLIAEMGGTDGGGKIVHYAHSIGAGDTERALAMMTPEECAMIDVTTFGAPILIGHDMGVAHVSNYVNVGDFISLLHPIKYFRALFSGDHSIHFVGSLGDPIIAHLFGGTVYQQVCETLGRYFVQLYRR